MSPQLIRTLRLKPEEGQRIDEFLDQNPFFDFSTLARIAITEFIQNPKLQLNAVGLTKFKTEKSVTKGKIKYNE